MARSHICLFVFILIACVSAKSQNARGLNIVAAKDSILDNITNIDKQIKDRTAVGPASISKLKIDKDSIPKANKTNLNIDSIITSIEFPLFEIQKQERRVPVIKTIDKNNWIPFGNAATFADTMIVDPVFLPVVFDGKILPDSVNLTSKSSKEGDSYHLIPREKSFAAILDKVSQVKDTRVEYFTNNAEYMQLSTMLFEKMPAIEVSIGRDQIRRELLTNVTSTVSIAPIAKHKEIKKSKWMFTGEHKLDVNQASFSDNFHSGADDYYNVGNYHKIISKYRYRKISFENTTEWRLNFQKNQGDTIHTLGITDDYLRTYSALNLDAFVKKWAYSLTLEMKTPIFNSFHVNRPVKGNKGDRKTSLFSPFEMTIGGGMSYGLERTSEKDRHRKLNMSVNISLISVNFKCVRDDLVDETRFGIPIGGDSRTDIGSTFNANMTYSFNRNVRLVSRFHYFSNYERVFSELENTFTFQLTNALSTNLYTYWRFDDSVGLPRKDEKWGYFQYQQRIGMGLSYRW